jgi:hypothetical protein
MMRFRVGETVGKVGQWKTTYRIAAIRKAEPRFQIQRGRDRKSRKWVLTEDIESLER